MTLNRRSWLLLSVAWVVPVLLAAAQEVARGQLGEGEPIGWLAAIARQLPFWAPLVALTPLLLAFVRRAAFDRRRWLRGILGHLVVLVLASLLFLLLSACLALPIEGRAITGANLAGAIGAMAIRTLHFHLFMVAAVMAAGYALENSRRLRERELHEARLRGQLAEARWATLSAQLQPHFLFNTLHSISSLVEEDTAGAQEMITALSDLLRHSLEADPRQRVSLREEMATVDLYLAIEKIRFQDRLREERQLEPAALEALVPSLLLQPLVENAIRHGIGPSQRAGRIEIRAEVRGDALRLEVGDDGRGLAAWRKAGLPEGLGLGNTRARLRELYGDRARLELSDREPRGTLARLSIPLEARLNPADDAEAA